MNKKDEKLEKCSCGNYCKPGETKCWICQFKEHGTQNGFPAFILNEEKAQGVSVP